MKRLLGLVVGFVLAGAMLFGGRAFAQDLDKPVLLVATPELQGPYRGTVLLAVPMGAQHLGFVLNRPTQTKLSDAFPEHAPSKAVTAPIYFGGPEASDALFAVLARDPGKPSVQLMPGLWMTGNGQKIDSIIEATPNEARYYAGFVGWQAGELAQELSKGYFVAKPVDAAKLFLPDTSMLYDQLAPPTGYKSRRSI